MWVRVGVRIGVRIGVGVRVPDINRLNLYWCAAAMTHTRRIPNAKPAVNGSSGTSCASWGTLNEVKSSRVYNNSVCIGERCRLLDTT